MIHLATFFNGGPVRKTIYLITTTALLLAGCAAKISVIDRTDGAIYSGTTEGGTGGGSGQATVEIEGEKYVGPWIYQPSGGSFGFGNFSTTTSLSGTATNYASGGMTALSGTGSSAGTASMFTSSAVGNGMLNAKAPSGKFIRCVFTFNTLQNTGIGECLRNDGRAYDMTLKR